MFGLEQEDGSLIIPMVLAYPLHPIGSSRGINPGNCVLDEVCPTDDLGFGLYTQFIICMRYSSILNIWNKLFLRDL